MKVTSQPNYPCCTYTEYATIDGVKRPYYVWASTDLPFAIGGGRSEEEARADFQSAVDTELEVIVDALREGELDLVRSRLTGNQGWWGRVWFRLTRKPNHIVTWSRHYDDGETRVHGVRSKVTYFDGYTKIRNKGGVKPCIELYVPEFDLHVQGSTLAEAQQMAVKAIHAHIDQCLSVAMKGYVNKLKGLFHRGRKPTRKSGYVKLEVLL